MEQNSEIDIRDDIWNSLENNVSLADNHDVALLLI